MSLKQQKDMIIMSVDLVFSILVAMQDVFLMSFIGVLVLAICTAITIAIIERKRDDEVSGKVSHSLAMTYLSIAGILLVLIIVSFLAGTSDNKANWERIEKAYGVTVESEYSLPALESKREQGGVSIIIPGVEKTFNGKISHKGLPDGSVKLLLETGSNGYEGKTVIDEDGNSSIKLVEVTTEWLPADEVIGNDELTGEAEESDGVLLDDTTLELLTK